MRARESRTEHESGAGGSVIGASCAVGTSRAPELRHHDDRGRLPRRSHRGSKQDESFSELSKQTIERAARHSLIGVRVPAAEFHRRDIRALILAEDSRRSLHQRRDATTSRVSSSHRLLAHELLLLQRGLEAIVQRSVSAIEHC